MVSTGAMIKRIEGLVCTKDVSSFENKFILDISVKTKSGKYTTGMSEKQISVVESIFDKHFAG